VRGISSAAGASGEVQPGTEPHRSHPLGCEGGLSFTAEYEAEGGKLVDFSRWWFVVLT